MIHVHLPIRQIVGVLLAGILMTCQASFTWAQASLGKSTEPTPAQPLMLAPEPPEFVPRGARQSLPAPSGTRSNPPGWPDENESSSGLPSAPVFQLGTDPTQPPPAPVTSTGIADPSPWLHAIHGDLDSARQHESSQLEAIQRNLEQLRSLNQNLRDRARAEQLRFETEHRRARRAEQMADDAKQQAELARETAEQTLERLERMQTAGPAVSIDHTPQIVDPSGNPSETLVSDSAHGTPTRTEKRDDEFDEVKPLPTSVVPVTSEAVDRDALANNLFGARQYGLALKIYADLLQESSNDEDVTWYQFQIAGCFRNLGKFPQAEKHYRMVAAQKDSYLAATARWYLSMLQDQKAITEQLARWDAFIGDGPSSEKSQER